MADRDLVDPRPDLEEDHRLWVVLLEAARDRPNPLVHDSAYWTLQGMRCMGVRLDLVADRLKMSPGDLGDEYEAVRNMCLVPRKELYMEIMLEAGRRLAKERADGEAT